MSTMDFSQKAQQNLAVSMWCYDVGHYDACCNRAYYAMYHAAIAVLSNVGIEPSEKNIDHGWVQGQFVSYFCNRHKMFPSFRRHLQDAQKIRDLADYHPTPVSRKLAGHQVTHAKEFVQSILKRLESYDKF